ncbi:hypothetical protein ACH5RR_038724 [Cinchona calisaya]|uniref:Uncharacterized protein n=1 Tax=Cinchona calisaya TaxID=153742 RepID=A0ABD2XYN3_9GENT
MLADPGNCVQKLQYKLRRRRLTLAAEHSAVSAIEMLAVPKGIGSSTRSIAKLAVPGGIVCKIAMLEAATITATTNYFMQSGTTNLIVQINEATMSSANTTTTTMIHKIMSYGQAIFAFIVGVLLSFLRVKYQGKDHSPFETHPKTIFVAILSLFVYCLSYDAKLKLAPSNISANYAYFLDINMAFFGPLLLASLSSILCPESLCPLIVFLSIFFSLCQLWQSHVKKIWNLLREAILGKFMNHQLRQRGRRRGGLASVQLPWFTEHANMDQIDTV